MSNTAEASKLPLQAMSDALEAAAKLRGRQENLRVVLITSAALLSGFLLSMPSQMQIWLKHYEGDFAAQAGMVSKLQALSAGITMLINPITANLLDAVGRKPIMMVGLAAAAFKSAAIAMKPGPFTLAMEALLSPLAMAHMQGAETVLGDSFKGDGTGYGGARAKFLMIPPLCAVVWPMIGGTLAARFGVRITYFLGATMLSCALALEKQSLTETLPPQERRLVTLKSGANLFSFLQLFQHSPKLTILTIMQIFNTLGDRRMMYQTEELHRQQVYKLDMQQRAAFMSAGALCSLPGYALASKLLQWLGAPSCVWLGMSLESLRAVLVAKSTKLSQMYWLLTLGSLRGTATSAISAMLQDEAYKCGLTQGEMQGYLFNLQAFNGIVTPMLWARIYSHGVSLGRPEFFLRFVLLFGVVQLLLERIMSTGRDRSLRDPR